jgi:hypothetical protein
MSTTTKTDAGAAVSGGTLDAVIPVSLRVGAGLPGAWALNLRLMYDAGGGRVTGMGEIVHGGVQGAPVQLWAISGQVFPTLVQGVPHLTVSLSGTCQQPPAMVVGPFGAHLVVDGDWNGVGSYKFFATAVNDVPVHRIA